MEVARETTKDLEEGELEDDWEGNARSSTPVSHNANAKRMESSSSRTDSDVEQDHTKAKKKQAQWLPGEESGEDMEISEEESSLKPSTSNEESVEVQKPPVATPKLKISLKWKPMASPTEEKEEDEGVEVDMDDEEEDEDKDDSDYAEEDGTPENMSSDSESEAAEEDDTREQPLSDEYLRLMPRPVLEKILQRLLKPPQSPQTRRVVQSLIQESIPETLAAYDTSLRIKVNETYTTMVQEMQDQHSSLTSDDFADVMARFLRNEIRVLQSFPGSSKSAFELILYIAEHSFGDLELDNRRGFGERSHFDKAADRALLYVAEQRLKEEGPVFRAAIPGYLEMIRSQAMYLYRHGIHPKSWFPASTTFLQSSLQVTVQKAYGRLRSQTR